LTLPENQAARPARPSEPAATPHAEHTVHGREADPGAAHESVAFAVASAPPDSPELPALLVELGEVLAHQADSGMDIAIIDQAFEVARAAVHRSVGHDPGAMRVALGQALNEVCGRVDWPAGLDEAVETYRAALTEAPADAGIQHDLGVVLMNRYEWTADAASVTEAREAVRAAVARAQPGSPDHRQFRYTLGSILLREYELDDDEDILGEAIAVFEALDSEPAPNESAATSARLGLAVALEARALATGETDDAQKAADLLIDVLPHAAHDDRPTVLLDLANILLTLHELTGGLDHVRQAVAHLREAARAHQGPSPEHASTLSSLSDAHRTLFLGEGRVGDLEAAVATARLAVDNSPEGAAGRPGYLVNLANALLTAFDVSGDTALVEEATDHARNAVASSVSGEAERGEALSCLGLCLSATHEATGELTPLDEAIVHQRGAIEALPPGHPHRAVFLSNLAISLCLRHEHTPDEIVLQDSIDTAREAVALTSEDDPDGHLHFQTLDRVLRERYRFSEALWALDEAIDTLRQALSLLADDDPDRPGCQLNLAASLLERHSARSDPATLREAVGLLRGVLTAWPSDAPDRALALYNLGLALAAHDTTSPQAAADAVAAFREAVSIRGAPPSVRAEAAVEWGRVAAAAGLWNLASEGFAAAVDLLPLVSPRHLDRGDQEHLLDLVDGAARDAVACMLQGGTETVWSALDVAERGRGVLFRSLMWPTADLDRLRAVDHGRATRFEQLRDALGSRHSRQMVQRSAAPGTSSAVHLEVRETTGVRKVLLGHLDDLVAEIRGLPGMEEFLTPPSAERIAAELAADTVVVINVSRYRSDALILDAGKATTVPLPALDWNRLTGISSAYSRILTRLRRGSGRVPDQISAALRELHGWLWDCVARPVLDAVGHAAPRESDWPRLWWCPTGPLTSLPLHAAHPYEARDDTVDGVGERVVPSYVPTLRTLAEIRRRIRSSDRSRSAALVVAVAGPDDSLHVARELDVVVEALGPQSRVLQDEAATRAAVRAALPTCRLLHFIGHGYQDLANPALGGLRLADGPLTALELAAIRLGPADLAYLSACEGAAGGVAALDDPLPPAMACLAGGFPQVIGTLWSVGDLAAADIAERFYRRWSMDAPDTVAEALHATVREIRSDHPPTVWAAFIHVGG